MRLDFGDLVLDTAARQLWRGGQEIHLRPKAFDLLELLVESRPRAVPKERIREHLWPDANVVEGNIHDVASEVRKALGDDPDDLHWVRTVAGFGYAFHSGARTEGGEPDCPWEARVILGQREIVLRRGENIIGRAHEASIWANDDSVSRRHAMIQVEVEGVFLEDCGSRNGTFRRAQRVRGAVRLEDLDEIVVGGVLLVVRVSHRDEHVAGGGSSRSTAPLEPTPPSSPAVGSGSGSDPDIL